MGGRLWAADDSLPMAHALFSPTRKNRSASYDANN